MKTIIAEVIEGYYGLFGNFYKELLEKGINCFNDKIERYHSVLNITTIKNIEKQFALELCSELMSNSLRVLMVDIRNLSENNLFQGANKKERYDFYSQMIATDAYKKTIQQKYPEFWPFLSQRTMYKVLLWEECINRLIKDAKEISNVFKIDIRNLTNIKMSSGDTHCKGRHVLILEFKDSKLIYKPHNLETDILWKDILNILNNSSDIKIKCMETIDKGEYGWQEYIELDNNSQRNLNNYFKKAGKLLAISNALLITDLHHENIIFAKDQPYIIDCETLIYNTTLKYMNRGNHNLNYLNKEITHSVMNTMLLPMASTFSALDFDIGGLSSAEKQISNKYFSFEVLDAGTDEIRFGKKPSLVENNSNKMYVEGKVVNIREYRSDIIEGYITTYNLIYEKREEILALLASKNTVVRQVFRPTATYARILEAATYPDYFESREKRLQMLGKVRINGKEDWEKINDKEIHDLMNGDIPYFYTKINSKSIFHEGTEFEEVYEKSLYEVVSEQLNNLNHEHLLRQVYYINLTLSTLKKSNNEAKVQYSFEKTNKLQLVETIADEFIRRGFKISDNNRDLTWIYVFEGDDTYRTDIANHSLYYMGGAMVLLIELFKKQSNQKYLEIVENYVKRQESFIDKLDNVSYFSGLGAFVYLYYQLYMITKKQEYYNKIEKTLLQISKVNLTKESLDIIGGVSGTIVLLSRMKTKMNINGIEEAIEKLAKILMEGLEQELIPKMTGLAHGYSGYAMALMAAGDILNDKIYIEKAEYLIDMEDAFYNEDKCGWKDIRYESFMKFDYWCHGSAGILISRLDMVKRINRLGSEKYNRLKTKLEKDIEIIGNMLLDEKYYEDDNFSLCHGLMGKVDALIEYSKYSKSDVSHIFDYVEKKIMEIINSKGFQTGNTRIIDDYSFMCGLTGIAYELIRIEDYDVPSILNLGD